MRAVAVLAAAVVLLWLALPAIVSPTLVTTTIREEDRLRVAWLGEAAERGILVRALRWLGRASEAGEAVAPHEVPADPLSVRFTAAAESVTRTPYVQRARLLARLAAHRLAALAEWFALGLPLLAAGIVDGVLMRAVRLRSFAHPSPVLFGIGLHGTLALLAGMAFALLVPFELHPAGWGASVAALAATLRIAVSNFHRIR